MKFAHLADTHLGYKQFGLLEREEDFYKVFEEIVERIIIKDPDFVIHSGDLFEFSKPSPNALLIFQEQFLKLKEAKIPVYAIAGNHDILMRKNAIPPQVLFRKLGLNLITPRNQYFIKDDIFIGGIPYHSKLQVDQLKDKLNKLSQNAEKYPKKILITHQGIDKYLPWNYELELADIPENFDYYACGHIHNRIIDDFGKGKLVYPGSMEIWKSNEVGNYLKRGKGFSLVNISENALEVENINIELPREFIQVNIQYSKLDEEIQSLKNYISNLNNKPVLNITVENGNFNRGDVYDKLNKSLGNICLKIKSTFKPEDILNNENLISDVTTLEPNELLVNKLKDLDNDHITKLAIELLDNLSNDKKEESERVVYDFFKKYFG